MYTQIQIKTHENTDTKHTNINTNLNANKYTHITEAGTKICQDIKGGESNMTYKYVQIHTNIHNERLACG